MGNNNTYNKNDQASITVEASLVLPVFIFGIMAILYFLQILLIQEIIQSAITQTGEFASQYAFIYDYIQNYEDDGRYNEKNESKNDGKFNNISKEYVDINNLGASIFYQAKMKEYINKDIIDNSCVIGGIGGISLLQSKFLEQNDMIEIIALYNIKIPVPIYRLGNILTVQSVKIRAFTGYKPINYLIEKKEDGAVDDRIVYITRTGTVYHIRRDCTYIKFNISECKFENLGVQRNDSGGKYYACESCMRDKHLDSTAAVYITSDGNRYHSTLSCSKLKRSVIEILLSKVQGRSPCSRCGGHGD